MIVTCEPFYSPGDIPNGIGNHLFQIACVYGTAQRYGWDWCLPPWMYLRHFPKLPRERFRNVIDEWSEWVTQQHGGDHEIVLPEADVVVLKGHWQSAQHFTAHEDQIRHWFSPSAEVCRRQAERWTINRGAGNVAVHIRRGDYLLQREPLALDNAYYREAVDRIGPLAVGARYYVFSDDLAFVRTNWPALFPRPVYVVGQPDWEDLFTMSLCDHFITANSTFSWWGAWLGSFPGKRVVTPELWWLSATAAETNSRLPADWIRIEGNHLYDG